MPPPAKDPVNNFTKQIKWRIAFNQFSIRKVSQLENYGLVDIKPSVFVECI